MSASQLLRMKYVDWMVNERGWSRETRRSRLQTMKAANRYLSAERGVTLLNARREDILSFIGAAAHPRSRNKRLGDLRAFYVFAVDSRIVKAAPTQDIRRVREPRLLPRPLSRAQALDLRTAAQSISRRAFTAVSILLYTGARREEAVNLAWSDVDLAERQIRIFGKGSRDRDVPIPPRLVPVLVAWRASGGAGESWLFPSPQRSGEHLGAMALYHDVKDAAALIGMSAIVSPHVCRHTYASELVRQGVDIRVVQELLGHASLANTQIYTQVVSQRLAADVTRLNFDDADEALPLTGTGR